MSDNRSYAVGMKNQGGAPVYMEDLKLSERSAVPNAASIANLKFLLTTGDDEGFRTAIKAYIDESIRAALGALVNNLDKGTAISRILATDSNNDLGSITPSNLANVLGVPLLWNNSPISDLNGFYEGICSYSWTRHPANVPVEDNGACLAIGNPNYCLQISLAASSIESGGIWFRMCYSTSWHPWVHLIGSY